MIIYFAGGGGDPFFKTRNVLESIAYPAKVKAALANRSAGFFLDSGTFTARKNGLKVDPESYAKFILGNNISVYANIDDPGNGATKTYANQKMLESLGVKPIAVFHGNNDFYWLEKYINEGYDYIAIGNTKGFEHGKRELYKKIFNIVCGNDDKPKIKIHGFGLTSLDMLKEFPFYSVDSTTWSFGKRAGQVFLPDGSSVFIGKGYIHQKNHFSNMTKNEQEKFDVFLNEFSNATREEFLNDWDKINHHNVMVMECWPVNEGIYMRQENQRSLFS